MELNFHVGIYYLQGGTYKLKSLLRAEKNVITGLWASLKNEKPEIASGPRQMTGVPFKLYLPLTLGKIFIDFNYYSINMPLATPCQNCS